MTRKHNLDRASVGKETLYWSGCDSYSCGCRLVADATIARASGGGFSSHIQADKITVQLCDVLTINGWIRTTHLSFEFSGWKLASKCIFSHTILYIVGKSVNKCIKFLHMQQSNVLTYNILRCKNE